MRQVLEVPKVNLQKPYQRPALRVYGDIEACTSVVGPVSTNMDGGTGGMNKTH